MPSMKIVRKSSRPKMQNLWPKPPL